MRRITTVARHHKHDLQQKIYYPRTCTTDTDPLTQAVTDRDKELIVSNLSKAYLILTCQTSYTATDRVLSLNRNRLQDHVYVGVGPIVLTIFAKIS